MVFEIVLVLGRGAAEPDDLEVVEEELLAGGDRSLT
jgi:hypothetical protein